MDSIILRKKFLDFFAKRGHTIVPSSSLIPDDSSVLLTTAGMQQFKKYFTGEADPIKDFGSKNTASIQKSFRTSDIDEVGDESHLTFFEMLGNFSFGGYGKKDAIQYAWEFLNEIFDGMLIEEVKNQNTKVKIANQNSKFFVTIFGGDGEIPADEESARIWRDEIGIPEELIERRGRGDNFWGPTGSSGPCGPTTEIFINGIEVWNLVFNEFFFSGTREEFLSRKSDKKLEKLKIFGVDTGMGLERLAMTAQGKKNIFETDLFTPITNFLVEEISSRMPEKSQRIIADHSRGIVFLVGDGVVPSNKDQGYVLRRLMRRTLSHLINFRVMNKWKEGELIRAFIPNEHTLEMICSKIIDEYSKIDQYAYLVNKKDYILNIVKDESFKFLETRYKNDKLFDKVFQKAIEKNELPGDEIFDLVTTHGIPLEWIKDRAEIEGGVKLDLQGFDRALKHHKEISRAGQEQKFGGHGLILNTGELKAANEEEIKIVTRSHTATHLLQAALRAVLGPEVEQRGSDITAERSRFDFSFSRKLTDEEKKRIEDWVNDKITRDLPMRREEMSYEEAIKSGALHFFREKYPERVNVYSVVDQKSGEVISREFCGGPHVTRTGEIGNFRITKEEAVGAGIRRIRAVVE